MVLNWKLMRDFVGLLLIKKGEINVYQEIRDFLMTCFCCANHSDQWNVEDVNGCWQLLFNSFCFIFSLLFYLFIFAHSYMSVLRQKLM